MGKSEISVSDFFLSVAKTTKITKSGTGSNEMLVITGVENVINENLH